MDAVGRTRIALRVVGLALGSALVLLLSFGVLLALNVAARLLLGTDEGAAGHAPDSPGVPVGALRWGLGLGLAALYPLVLRTRWTDAVKAVLIAAPVGVLSAAFLVSFYDRLWVAGLGVAAVAAGVVLVLRRLGKPWEYYVAAGFALALAVAYGWPPG